MRNLTLACTAAVAAFWSVATTGGCGSGPQGEEPTTVSTGAGAAGSGAGATTGGGDGGMGGTSSASGGGTTSSTGGNGGAGGMMEEMIHGCLSTTATDLTGMGTANIDIPGGTYCIRVSSGTQVTFTLTDVPGNHRPLGGFYDGMVKFPDAQSPIISCCDISPYDCCPMVTNPPFDMQATGAFPWYDDKNPDTIKGVVYVE